MKISALLQLTCKHPNLVDHLKCAIVTSLELDLRYHRIGHVDRCAAMVPSTPPHGFSILTSNNKPMPCHCWPALLAVSRVICHTSAAAARCQAIVTAQPTVMHSSSTLASQHQSPAPEAQTPTQTPKGSGLKSTRPGAALRAFAPLASGGSKEGALLASGTSACL